MGFLVICSGVVLLQFAKSSKDVPDTAVFKGDLDQVRTIAEQEEPEYEPRADTMRGGAAIVRALSRARTKRQAQEAHRIREERLETVGENEQVHWDGLRRRTTLSEPSGSVIRRKPVHPPLGMTHFPDEVSEPDSEVHPGFFGRITRKSVAGRSTSGRSGVPLDDVGSAHGKAEEGSQQEHVYGLPSDLQKRFDGAQDVDTSYHSPTAPSAGKHLHWAGDVANPDRVPSRGSSLAPPPPPPPPHAQAGGASGPNKRTFSFQNVFHRHRSDASAESGMRPTSRGAHSFASRGSEHAAVTEEERLGLVQGDSSKHLPKYEEVPDAEERADSDEWQMASSPERLVGASAGGDIGKQRTKDPYEDYDDDTEDDLTTQTPRTPADYDKYGGRGSFL